MLHIDLNTQTEQRLIELIKQKFQGSFEAFIQSSLEKQTLISEDKTTGKLSDYLLAPEIDIDDNFFERSKETARDVEL